MGNPVVHFEIGCRDLEKTSRFYADLFGWNLNPMGPSVGIDTGSGEGIQGHMVALGHEPHNFVNVYVQVDDLEASAARATGLGGRVVVPVTDVPGAGQFVWVADPEGTVVGLWKPRPA